MLPPINSFIYRKKVKYGYTYFYINLLTEERKELSSQIEGYIHADDEVTLTNIEELPDNKYRILPIATFAVTLDGNPIDAGKLTVDQLIDSSYQAARLTLESRKLCQDL